MEISKDADRNSVVLDKFDSREYLLNVLPEDDIVPIDMYDVDSFNVNRSACNSKCLSLRLHKSCS